MPTARSNLGVAVVDGKIYAIGGYNGNNLGTNEMYDPENNTWTTKTVLWFPNLPRLSVKFVAVGTVESLQCLPAKAVLFQLHVLCL